MNPDLLTAVLAITDRDFPEPVCADAFVSMLVDEGLMTASVHPAAGLPEQPPELPAETTR